MRLLKLIGRARQVRSSRAAVRWLFLRALGAVYLIAFTSLRVQVLGLYGSRGIRPIRELLAALRAQAGRRAYQLAPSLLWLGSSDRDLVRFCRAGQISSLGLLLGVAPGPMSAATWALYLSFVTVGREFLHSSGLEGSPDVLKLLGASPFPDRPHATFARCSTISNDRPRDEAANRRLVAARARRHVLSDLHPRRCGGA